MFSRGPRPLAPTANTVHTTCGMPDIDASTMRGYLSTAINAVGNADFDAAETAVMQAELCLAGIPDSEMAGDRMTWRENIASIRNALATRRGAVLGIRRQRYQPARPSS